MCLQYYQSNCGSCERAYSSFLDVLQMRLSLMWSTKKGWRSSCLDVEVDTMPEHTEGDFNKNERVGTLQSLRHGKVSGTSGSLMRSIVAEEQ